MPASTPIPTRFSAAEIHDLDRLVALGYGINRSDVVRRALRELAERAERAELGERIVAGYQRIPPTADEDAWADLSTRALLQSDL